jgi:hypothetical protein
MGIDLERFKARLVAVESRSMWLDWVEAVVSRVESGRRLAVGASSA